jgi:hypothetical protein
MDWRRNIEDIVCYRFLLLVDPVSMGEKKDDSSVLEDFLTQMEKAGKGPTQRQDSRSRL